MHGRVRDLPKIGLSQQRHVVVFLLVLVGGLFCSSLAAEAKSDHDIINTGVNGGGCWYDESHFIVVKGQQSAPGQEFEVEGLYYLDPNHPKDLKRVDLSPLEPSLQRHIRDVTCQDENILFLVLTADRKGNQLYLLKIGHPPVLLAEKRDGFAVPREVSVKNRYVLSFSSALKERGGQSSATPEEARTDCPFAYLHPQYRVVCLRHDRGTKQRWLADTSFLTKYLWDETIRIGQEGAYKWVPNPEPPLKLSDGTETKQGYLLRDLENRIVQRISFKQDPVHILTVGFKPDPSGMFLYSVCYKVGDHGDRFYTQGGRICRYLLNGINPRWEEVVSVQQSPKDPFSLHALDVNAQGDVVMIERGHRLVVSLWKYSTQSKQVDRLLQVNFPHELGAPAVSPSGKWVSAIRNGQLIFIEQKRTKP
jgi:hypothetical protein